MKSSCEKRLSANSGPRPPVILLFLSLTITAGLIALCGSPSSAPVVGAETGLAEAGIYRNYRRLKEEAAADILELRVISSGHSRQKVANFCGKERENHVPCYNSTASQSAGFADGDMFDRDCELRAGRADHCIVRTPKDYKIPMRWPAGRDIIWSNNVKITKDQFLSSGSTTKRLMLLEENQIAFHSDDGLVFDGVKDYSRQIAEMIGLGSDTDFFQRGVRTVLDLGCGFGSFSAHLLSLGLMAICVAAYESTGSQVQLALERGLPAMIGNFASRQLPYPSLSFDMIHCAQCGVDWDPKGSMLLEMDRLMRPGGYFVVTSPSEGLGKSTRVMKEHVDRVSWSLLSEQDQTAVWRKTTDASLNAVRRCEHVYGDDSYYHPLVSCVSGTTSPRWIPAQNKSSQFLQIHGVDANELYEDVREWGLTLRNYWPLLTPLIFSDHPKRPGDEDPTPPFNMIRNVMDMNAGYAGLNTALLDAGKSVWVMNVVPTTSPPTLPFILDLGYVGALHDWCDPFPTYPRTYDMLYGRGLLSLVASANCSLVELFIEMDRMLRPEGWVVLSDNAGLVDQARMMATRVRWDARLIDPVGGGDQRLLVSQKPFLRK